MDNVMWKDGILYMLKLSKEAFRMKGGKEVALSLLCTSEIATGMMEGNQ